MITATKEAIAALQSADDRACKLPLPGSRLVDGRWQNVCWSCGAVVAGPDTRYRCKACGRTVDDDPRGADQHIYDVGDTYPATAAALAVVQAAKAKLDRDRTAVEKELAAATVDTKPASEPIEVKP